MSFSAFLAFPGQGSQHLSMFSRGGIFDLANSSKYSHAVECCSDLIGHDVIKLIEEGPEELINITSITQPILVLCSYLHFHKLVNTIDPASCSKIKINDVHRLRRVWEVHNYTGIILSNWLIKEKKNL